MQSIQKRWISLFVCFALLLTVMPVTVLAKEAISVTIDGKKVSFGVSPQQINGRTMVPYRTLAEQLGAKVAWNEKTKQATITKGSKKVELTIGSKKATINGKSISLDTAPVVRSGNTLVPLRFVGESLGVWVSWNAASSTASLETKKTFTHAMGKTTLNKVPERIVILFNGMVDVSVLLGVKPVGAVESYVEQPFYNFIRANMSNVKVLGDETQPNLEAIVSLKPDLIIATKVRHEKINAQLSKIAPTIQTEDFVDWKDNLKTAAAILNKEEVANKFLGEWNSQVADFKKKMGSRTSNTTVSVIRFNPDGSSRAYMSGFATNILKDLGFKFPKAQIDTGKEIVTITTKEQIPIYDADYIFDFTKDWNGDGGVYKVQKEWTESPLWKNLKAVKNNKYYKVNAVSWNFSAGPLAAKMMLDDLYFYFDLE